VAPPCPRYGFLVRIAPRVGTDAGTLAADLARGLETLGLALAGESRGGHLEFAVVGEGMQATDQDRHAVERWLAARDDADSFEVGPLVDTGDAA